MVEFDGKIRRFHVFSSKKSSFFQEKPLFDSKNRENHGKITFFEPSNYGEGGGPDIKNELGGEPSNSSNRRRSLKKLRIFSFCDRHAYFRFYSTQKP